jgi:hypothetical protein
MPCVVIVRINVATEVVIASLNAERRTRPHSKARRQWQSKRGFTAGRTR